MLFKIPTLTRPLLQAQQYSMPLPLPLMRKMRSMAKWLASSLPHPLLPLPLWVVKMRVRWEAA